MMAARSCPLSHAAIVAKELRTWEGELFYSKNELDEPYLNNLT